MSLLTIFREYWRFIKANIWRLILGAIIGCLVLLGARYALGNIWMNNRDQAYQYLNQVYQQEPAEFQVIISIEDGQLFTSANIYDEYFSSPAVINQIEEQTGISFGQALLYEKELDLFKNDNYRGGIAAIRESSSGLITFRFLIGKTSQENLKIAQAYADLLKAKTFDFNQNHFINITRQPEIIELLELDVVQNVPTKATLNMFAGMTPKNIVVFSVLGIILGLILTSFILWYRKVRKNEITYAFEYAWDIDDHHLLFEQGLPTTHDDFYKLIQIPYLDCRYVVNQAGPDSQLDDEIKKKDGYYYLNNLLEASAITEKPQEIVILIYSNVTLKEWYQTQYTLANLYQVPIKIIHFV